MKVYSYSEARQRFADVLRNAKREGQAQIRRRDGQLFLVQPANRTGSPLDVPARGNQSNGTPTRQPRSREPTIDGTPGFARAGRQEHPANARQAAAFQASGARALMRDLWMAWTQRS